MVNLLYNVKKNEGKLFNSRYDSRTSIVHSCANNCFDFIESLNKIVAYYGRQTKRTNDLNRKRTPATCVSEAKLVCRLPHSIDETR